MGTASETSEAGVSALQNLKQATDPQLWLTPNPSISQTARAASEYLFATLKPFTPKAPFDRLLVDGFDAEQIWQQIDLQSQPLLSSLKRKLNQLKKNPEEIEMFGTALRAGMKVVEEKKEEPDEDSDGFDEELDGFEEEEEEEEEDEDLHVGERKKSENSEDEGSKGEEGESEEEGGKVGGGIEDRFLKIKELEDYLVDGEEEEYEGREPKNKNKVKKNKSVDDGEDGEDEDSEDDDELEDDDDEDESGGDGETANAMYADFFTGKKRRDSKERTNAKSVNWSEHINDGDEEDNEMRHSGESDLSDASEEQDDKKLEAMSTHEKEQHKLRLKIKQLEKANMEPKTWTMIGEVTADKRPKNSALEEDLDFEHNVRPAPVITEEVTASLEEMIKKRILEGHFDDVLRMPKLPSQAPRGVKELDDNKSKKGLAEVYEDEYVQKTDPASAPLAVNNEMKKEASLLFKKLCLRLDALSHFHFTPKPVVEEMSIQSNVPALAMEEIAPIAVSDAAMLAPEEVFSGKGDIKEESELSQAERKRRRADKKRKFKAETAKRVAKKARGTQSSNRVVDGKDE